ncbi:hypothetical protein D3C83_92040 [compost metagenome]
MAMESKYTSPAPVKVAQALAANAAARPRAIGVSRLRRRWRASCQAPRKNGPPENSSTGAVITKLAQPIRAEASGVSVAAPAST